MSLLATLGALGLGTVLGYTSPALPDLKNSTTFGHLDEADHSWIGSVAPVKQLGLKYFISLLGIVDT